MLEWGQPQQALEQFEKALELDRATTKLWSAWDRRPLRWATIEPWFVTWERFARGCARKRIQDLSVAAAI